MRFSKTPHVIVIILLGICFLLATNLDAWFSTWDGNRAQTSDPMNVMLGDARRMFANHFFVKADEYFHSGYYPTIFDNQKAVATPHIAADSGTSEDRNVGDDLSFLGKPHDWIDAFSRNFYPTRHTHLDEGGASGELGDSSEVREILPWLKLSAELDPNDVRTYVVTAYWLRRRMHEVDKAEKFLFDGLRANPGSYEIQYELGCVYDEDRHDPIRARNLWKAALANWHLQEDKLSEPDKFLFTEITSHLALLEEKQGDYAAALSFMKMWKSMSPDQDAVQKRIEEFERQHPDAIPSHAGSPSSDDVKKH